MSLHVLLIIWVTVFSSLVNASEGSYHWIPLFASSPETGVSGGLLLTHNLSSEQDGRNSSISYVVEGTEKSQTFASIRPQFYFFEGDLLIQGLLLGRYFPSLYYGNGNQTLSESAESFTEETFAVSLGVGVRLFWNLHASLGVSRTNRRILKEEPLGLLETNLNDGDRDYRLLGEGGSFYWDSRENIHFPDWGSFVRLSGWRFRSTRGGPYDYNKYTLSWSSYIPLFAQQVLAIHGLGQKIEGVNIPFQSLLTLGGSSLLRGYYRGRFRDRVLLAGQLEYRIRFERWGFGLFTDGGKVANTFELLKDEPYHKGYGVGFYYFFASQNRTHARVDLASTEEGHSFYIAFDQAF